MKKAASGVLRLVMQLIRAPNNCSIIATKESMQYPAHVRKQLHWLPGVRSIRYPII